MRSSAPSVGLLEIVYGLYAATVFLVFGLLAFALVLLPFGINARRHIAHFAARAFFPSPACPSA